MLTLPLFDEPRTAPRPPIPFPIAYGTPYYVEYWTWFRNGQRDDAAPNDVPGDPHVTYAQKLGYRHGRLLRPIDFKRERS